MSNFNIGRKDVIWNYAATFLKIGSGIILLPFILRIFSSETIAVWNIFLIIPIITGLFDLGFNSSFARNVSYVASGVKELKTTGYQIVENNNKEIDYSLFKGLIHAMRWFYARVAMILFVVLSTAGTYYIHTVLKTYSGDHVEVYTSWALVVLINSYSLYTMYYEAIMQGKGLIKRSKQIQIADKIIYLIVTIILLLLRFNLIAVVSAQVLSVIVRRMLSYRVVYTAKFKQSLHGVKVQSVGRILKSIYPNAIKVGVNAIGLFLILQIPLIVGSLYLPLDIMASYGITIQIITVIFNIASVYYYTYQPKMIQTRVQSDNTTLKILYVNSCWIQFLTFVICGLVLIFFGDYGLLLIKSKTTLLPLFFIITALLVFFFTLNYGLAEAILLTKNEVPFFKASFLTGVATLILLFVFLRYISLGVWSLILAPGIAQAVYSNWKWPAMVAKELGIKKRDIYNGMRSIFNKIKILPQW